MNVQILGLSLNAYILIVVAVASVIVVVAALVPRQLRYWHALVALGFLLALFVLAAVPIDAVVGLFGLLNLAYKLGVIVPPVLGAALIARAAVRRGRRRNAAFGVLALIPGIVGFYATNIEPNQLEVNTFTVPSAMAEPVRIGVLADIQSPSVGPHERRAISEMQEQRTDLILIAGDTYSGEDGAMPRHQQAFTDLLKGLSPPGGVYMVQGDHDSDAWLPRLATASGHTLLVDRSTTVEVRGQRIAVLGIRNDHSSAEAVAAMKRFAAVPADYRIVLAHHPDAIDLVPPEVDLVVSGHTHGGQVNLPVVGPLLTLSGIPRHQAAGGLFEYPQSRLFVTRGVGVERSVAPFLRLGAPPEINVLELRPR